MFIIKEKKVKKMVEFKRPVVRGKNKIQGRLTATQHTDVQVKSSTFELTLAKQIA